MVLDRERHPWSHQLRRDPCADNLVTPQCPLGAAEYLVLVLKTSPFDGFIMILAFLVLEGLALVQVFNTCRPSLPSGFTDFAQSIEYDYDSGLLLKINAWLYISKAIIGFCQLLMRRRRYQGLHPLSHGFPWKHFF